MRTNLLLTKALIVVALLLGGVSSVWADNVVLNPTADTYFGWDSDDEKATSYGNVATLRCGIWQEYWTNATPGLRNGNNVQKIAVFKFDVSPYKEKSTNATFTVTATNPSTNDNTRSIYLGYFDLTNWDETTNTNNSGMVTRHATNLNIHPFALSQSIGKGVTKEVSFTNSAFVEYLNTDADGIISLIIYGTGQECTVNSKEAESGKPTLTLTYTEETLYSATFNEGNNLNPTITVYSDEGKTTVIAYNQLSANKTYYYKATLAGYNDFEGSFQVATSDPTVNFTMTAKPRYTFTVNAINSVGNAVIKEIYTDNDSYEGKTHNFVCPKYLTDDNNIVTFSKDNNTYGESKTAKAENETYTVSYTAYDGVAYFIEVEDVVSGTAYDSWNCSNGGAVRGFTTAKDIFTIPADGIYNVEYAICNNNVNNPLSCTLSKNSTEIETTENLQYVSINYIKTTGIVTNNDIPLKSGDVLQLTPSSTNGIVDYMLIKINSVPATLGANGYTTFASPLCLDLAHLPEGLKAYTATLYGKNLSFQLCEQTVPAGTGLLLQGTGGETYNIPVVSTFTTVDNNALTGVTAVTPLKSDETNYIFAMKKANSATDELLFAPLTSANNVNFPAGKAYITVPASAFATPNTARALVLTFDDATSVKELKNSGIEELKAYYNLQGQRVASPKKGLYIVNGRKVQVK